MIYWTIKFPKYIQDIDIIRINLNTLYLVGLASLVLVFISLFINYGSRISKSKILNYLTNFSISGYAIPGVILAVAFITLISYLDNLLSINFKTIFIGSVFYNITLGDVWRTTLFGLQPQPLLEHWVRCWQTSYPICEAASVASRCPQHGQGGL